MTAKKKRSPTRKWAKKAIKSNPDPNIFKGRNAVLIIGGREIKPIENTISIEIPAPENKEKPR